jgi:alpha-beta hydrolase superfamily lysophospholipase
MQDLVRLNKYCNDKSWYDDIDKKMPILLVSGSEDPVGDYGKGVRNVYERLKSVGANVQIRLYEGYRHEILNDFCRDQVVEDIRAFVNA